MPTSAQEARQILDDMAQDSLEREHALYFLAKQNGPDILDRLVAALDDDSFGVRWAAASVLADMGQAALPTVLSALTTRAGSSWMREGVYHILHYNSSLPVREKSAELMAALKGPGSDIAAPVAALRLSQALR